VQIEMQKIMGNLQEIKFPFYPHIMYKRIWLLILLSLGFSAGAQTITTVAGSGATGYNGDVPALETTLWSPSGVSVGYNGSVYIADRRNNRVRKINPQGTVVTIAGIDESGFGGDNGPATDAQLNNPCGIATDGYGNVYIADKNNNRIRKITGAGIISTLAGTGEAGYGGDDGPAIAGQLNAPTGIATDLNGNIYIADAGNNRIRKISADGIITTIAGTGVAGYNNDTIATAAQLNAPNGVATDTAGNVYIADTWNYRIRKVTPAGIIRTMAGDGNAGYNDDGKASTAAQLNMPTGVAADRAGNIYIADEGNNRIRRINAGRIITTFAGTGKTGFSGDGGNAWIAELNEPHAVAVDRGGNLYIADRENNRIRRVTPPTENGLVIKTKPPLPEGKPPAPKPFTLPEMNNSMPVRGINQSKPVPYNQTNVIYRK
jgi:sugar lactone lactonase YvrE